MRTKVHSCGTTWLRCFATIRIEIYVTHLKYFDGLLKNHIFTLLYIDRIMHPNNQMTKFLGLYELNQFKYTCNQTIERLIFWCLKYALQHGELCRRWCWRTTANVNVREGKTQEIIINVDNILNRRVTLQCFDIRVC